MSDSANGLGPPATGEMWQSRNGTEWAAPRPGLPEETPTGDLPPAGQREDEVRPSYFHVRWLGEDD